MRYIEDVATVEDECCQCGQGFNAGDEMRIEDEIGDILPPACIEDYEQNQAEAAYERYLSRYYGGEVPTMREQVINAWTQGR